jgi:hypothetical protein
MARVVAVHGILNQYGSRPTMHNDWVPALLGGVENATGRRDALTDADIECVFYGDVFRPPGRRLSTGGPVLSADDVTDPYERELLVSWWQAAAAADPAVVPPNARTLGLASLVQRALNALASSRSLAGLAESALIFLLRQVRLYFTDDQIRATIQEIFARSVGPDTRVVVAHSLGTVVAYEALCAHPQWPIHTLVTLGSPLGVPNLIFDRLRPEPDGGPPKLGHRPPQVRAWTNIADAADFVALAKKLSTRFPGSIDDIEIDNGATVHDVRRYLTAASTGAAVAAGLTADA